MPEPERETQRETKSGETQREEQRTQEQLDQATATDTLLRMPTGSHLLYARGSHLFELTPTDQVGVHSGRRRCRVECFTCKVTVHEATTGPFEQIRYHLNSGELSLGESSESSLGESSESSLGESSELSDDVESLKDEVTYLRWRIAQELLTTEEARFVRDWLTRGESNITVDACAKLHEASVLDVHAKLQATVDRHISRSAARSKWLATVSDEEIGFLMARRRSQP